MSVFGKLVLAAPDWLLPAGTIFLCALAMLAWTYWRSTHAPFLRWVALPLKALGFLLLALLLLEPVWNSTEPEQGVNLFVLLADNSRSLEIRDAPADQTRLEQLSALLTDEGSSWMSRLAEEFKVRRYLFDARLRQTGNFEVLDGQGNGSNLFASLDELTERFENQPLAGILLFTDGVATDESLLNEMDADLPPIYPIPLGTGDGLMDLSIADVSVSQTQFEDAPVTVQASIGSISMVADRLKAEVIDLKTGELVERQSQEFVHGNRRPIFRFQLKPQRPGVSFYQVQISGVMSSTVDDLGEPLPEAVLANNERIIAVDHGSGPLRILYVAGRPNWEHKYLGRALKEDNQLELVSLIRIAKREAKFKWRGRQGQDSNPLFEGFEDIDKEATEQYDEPVLVRQGVRDAEELRAGFPKTEKELFKYHGVILDDLEAAFFTRDQLALLERFVSRRGGGLLMLGGMESFAKGNYAHTPLANVLPVYLDGPSREDTDESFRLSLSRDGWHQPWLRLATSEEEERKHRAQMPEFFIHNSLGALKPGGTVFLESLDDQGLRIPTMAAQRFGDGRAAVLALGDMWRWRMQASSESQAEDLDKTWRQITRWLVADVPQRVDLRSQRSVTNASQIILTLNVCDESYQEVDFADVELQIDTPDGQKLPIQMEPTPGQLGQYQATFSPREQGAYLATITAKDSLGVLIGTDETGWASQPAAEEFRTLSPNRDLLEQLAEKSGGELVELENLNSFITSLKSRKLPVMRSIVHPLWHRPSVFLFAVLCFAGEWGIRRWRGVA